MGCSDCDTAGRLTPGVLTSDQQLALIFETGSVQSLLRHGVDQLFGPAAHQRRHRPGVDHVVHRRRKAHEADLGLLEVAASRSWPSRTVMQDQGHGVKSRNELIDPHLAAAVDLPAQPWVQGLRDGVNNKQAITALGAARQAEQQRRARQGLVVTSPPARPRCSLRRHVCRSAGEA